jgi:hypothetical protein
MEKLSKYKINIKMPIRNPRYPAVIPVRPGCSGDGDNSGYGSRISPLAVQFFSVENFRDIRKFVEGLHFATQELIVLLKH